MKLVDPNAPAPTSDAPAPARVAQVLRWKGLTKHDYPAETVLQGALGAGLKCVVVLGYDAEGQESFASSMADGADVVWLMERLKRQLLATSGGESW